MGVFIKEVEQKTNLTKKNIRYYEEAGLIKPKRDSENDYRIYSDSDIKTLKNIKILRELGVPIKEIKELNENINSQLKEMFFKNFIENKSINILRNYPRYLKAVEVRLEKYRKDPSKDAEKAEEINKLTIKLNREKAARRGVEDPRLDEFENLLQELRVSLFTQELRTPMLVSVKRLNKVWDSLIGSSRGFSYY